MRRSLDPELLETFLAVLEHGGIGRAARAIPLSQPAVTARIRKLEAAVGTPLLLRGAQGIAPTPAGAHLAERARAIRRLLEEAWIEASATALPRGDLVLAASHTIAEHVLPSLLARFRTLHPSIRIELRIANTREVVQAVRKDQVPLGLVEGVERAVGLKLEPWLEDELLPVCAPSFQPMPTRIEDLAHAPILWREEGSGSRAVLEKALEQYGVRRHPLPQDPVLGANGVITAAALRGLGVAFLSRWVVGPHIATRALRLLPMPLRISRTLHFVLPPSPLAPTPARFHQMATLAPPAPP